MSWIGNIDEPINFSRQARRAGGGVNEVAAVVEVAMRPRAAGLEMAKSSRTGRLADVEDVKTFRVRLTVGAAPARGDAFQSCDHLAVGDLDLDRPGILWSRN